MINKKMIAFFYVNDIVICYRKKNKAKARAATFELWAKYTMNKLKSLKWFLEVHVLQNRVKRLLWLSQEAYVDKLTNQFAINMTDRLLQTFMIRELLLNKKTVMKASVHIYQKKTGSILFIIIIIRPDIAFAASRLARFNQNSGDSHHDTVNWVIQYLYITKSRALRYEDDFRACSFICTNNILFADNTLNQKSSQGYIMLLFRESIAWKINKQNTVTMSSTKAELLVLSQTAKKAIFTSQLLNALTLRFNKLLIIKCDNQQTLRLVMKDFMKLSTKLQHMNIHNHWLQQEYSEQRVLFNWTPTHDMIADGLMKALPQQ